MPSSEVCQPNPCLLLWSLLRQDGDYGKSRLWGAVGWGGVSTLSGWVVSSYGMNYGFVGYLLLSLPCVVVAWQMKYNMTHSDAQVSAGC